MGFRKAAAPRPAAECSSILPRGCIADARCMKRAAVRFMVLQFMLGLVLRKRRKAAWVPGVVVPWLYILPMRK